MEEVVENSVTVDEPSECPNDDEEIFDLDNVNSNSTFINHSQDDKKVCTMYMNAILKYRSNFYNSFSNAIYWKNSSDSCKVHLI